jgi:hypothetical protein
VEDLAKEIAIPLTFVALKTIQEKGEAENEDITRIALRLRKEGLNLGAINYHYTPGGPCSPEVQATLGILLSQDDIEELSPAKMTSKGEGHLRELEETVREDLPRIESIIKH